MQEKSTPKTSMISHNCKIIWSILCPNCLNNVPNMIHNDSLTCGIKDYSFLFMGFKVSAYCFNAFPASCNLESSDSVRSFASVVI